MEALVSACCDRLRQLLISASTSGSRMMVAGRPASPAATWSIHFRYAAWLGMPPELAPLQSRFGML